MDCQQFDRQSWRRRHSLRSNKALPPTLSAVWFSGSRKTATRTIVDQTTGVDIGNNFALDALSLKALT